MDNCGHYATAEWMLSLKTFSSPRREGIVPHESWMRRSPRWDPSATETRSPSATREC